MTINVKHSLRSTASCLHAGQVSSKITETWKLKLRSRYRWKCLYDWEMFLLIQFGHLLVRYFGHWDISVICLTAVSKLAVTVFFSLYFQTFWPKWLNFFRSFQNHFGLWPKIKQLYTSYVKPAAACGQKHRNYFESRHQMFMFWGNK